MAIHHFECSCCGKTLSPDEVTYVCPDCGGNLDTRLDYEFNPGLVSKEGILDSREMSIWRYTALLPVSDPGFQPTPLHAVGMTPVYRPPLLEKTLGMRELWIKDESRNPSASFKDRASAVVIARAIETDVKTIVAASTGNAGAAMACMSASVARKAIILAPRSAPPAKIAQLLTFGAQVILVEGTYDQAFDLSIEASHEFGWYNRNTGYNPFTVEGKKTAAYEIWEQVLRHMPERSEPLTVFIPVGDGNILSGLAKGFKDLLHLGWIDRLPRLVGVQADGSAAIANAFFSRSDTIMPISATTLADSISVDLPRDGLRALKAVRETGGWYVTVPDEEILKAIPALGKAGLFVEPAAATAYAGLLKSLREGLLDPAAPALVLCTGSGLKDVRAATMAVNPAPVIEPTLAALKGLLHG
ncbi:MAG: threonine synthase [Anaerolineaceae bacterium]|jgi:threonine synthase|nr:threonine synthase [Anaerolineaceae bacterium]HNX46235.1 threonine synthase [Anaerolineaceae bacterium]HPT23592.1 threonine synthase [Anaerolineaceae bacterium]